MQAEKEQRTYLDTYVLYIRPKLMQIDLLVKTSEDFIPPEEMSEALNLSLDEVNQIMKYKHMDSITRSNFTILMENGSSQICKLYQREKYCGSPYFYSRDEIAYIYDIDIDKVNAGCDRLQVKEITPFTLPMVLAEISL